MNSTQFTYVDVNGVERDNCYLKETDELVEEYQEVAQFSTKGVKRSAKYNVDIMYGSSLIVFRGIGIINHTDGVLELEGFQPVRIANSTSSEMTFTVRTEKYKLSPKKEQIFAITSEDIEVNSIPNDDELSASSTLEKASLLEI